MRQFFANTPRTFSFKWPINPRQYSNMTAAPSDATNIGNAFYNTENT